MNTSPHLVKRSRTEEHSSDPRDAKRHKHLSRSLSQPGSFNPEGREVIVIDDDDDMGEDSDSMIQTSSQPSSSQQTNPRSPSMASSSRKDADMDDIVVGFAFKDALSLVSRVSPAWIMGKRSFTIVDQHFSFNDFLWDLGTLSVSLAEPERLIYLERANSYLDSAKNELVSHPHSIALSAYMDHLSHIWVDGKEKGEMTKWVRHSIRDGVNCSNPPTRVLDELKWWRDTLTNGVGFVRSLINEPVTRTDLFIYTDAALSWGLGLVVGGKWDAWKLKPRFPPRLNDQTAIEALAVEIGARVLVAQGHRNERFVVRTDNQTVINAFQNQAPRRLTELTKIVTRTKDLLAKSQLSLCLIHVPSADNIADSVSRGVFPPANQRLTLTYGIPPDVTDFFDRPIRL